MDNKLIGVIMSVVVGVILIGSLLAPTLSDASKTEETFDNSPFAYYQMKTLENGDKWTHSQTTWTFNDTILTTSENTGVSVVATNNTVVRQDGIIRGTTYGGNATSSAEVLVVDETNTLQLNSTRNINYISGFGAVPEGGQYVLKTYDSSVYVHEDTPLWITGYTSLADGTTSQVMVHIEGTIKDGLTITLAPKQGGTTTDLQVVGDYRLNYSEVSGYKDLYQLTNVKFDVSGTFEEATYTKEFSYSTFIVPKEITAELSNHLDSGEIALLGSVLVIFIASLVIIAIRSFTGRND